MKPSKLRIQLFSITVVWIILILLAVDFALAKIRPLQYITDLRFIPLDQHPMVSKIPLYLELKDHVDYLFLGSSLPMCAIAEYDQKCFGEPDCKVNSELTRYIGARYLEENLPKLRRCSAKAANLSIVSCMSSDMYIILSKSIDAGKRPGAVVLCIAPRDFMDNFVQPIGRTPPFELLQDWKSVNEILRPSVTISEKRDLLISAIWYFYRVKVDYRTVFTEFAASFFKRPSSLYYASRIGATSQQVALPSQQAATLEAINKIYIARYRPPNKRRFDGEMNFFRKLLSLCLKEKINCVVINMPASRSHQSLIDPGMNISYLNATKEACKSFGAEYLDFNDSEFQSQDFSDGLHLNADGAEKFQKRLIRNMANKINR